MKVYSVLIVSVTLFVFYNLAVFQENFAGTKDCSTNDVSASHYDAVRSNVNEKSIQCSVSIAKITDQEYYEAHHVGQDDFALQVTGKDHQYLNTGVSFIYEDGMHEELIREPVDHLSELELDSFESGDDQDSGLHAYSDGSIDESINGSIGQSKGSRFRGSVLE